MEIHDDDESNSVSVFQDDDTSCDPKQKKEFTSPTELYFSARKQYKEALDRQFTEHSQKRSRATISRETNESEQRYEHLPEYAKASFVPAIECQAMGSTLLASGKVVPSDPRILEILKRTAIKAISMPQIEIMLKVKESHNEDFIFLQPHHQWHCYYLHLKEMEEKKQNLNGVALLGMYSDSDDDNPPEVEVTEPLRQEGAHTSVRPTLPQHGVPLSIKEHNETTCFNDEAARKAKRLKRAKMMKGHYALKLMENISYSQA